MELCKNIRVIITALYAMVMATGTLSHCQVNITSATPLSRVSHALLAHTYTSPNSNAKTKKRTAIQRVHQINEKLKLKHKKIRKKNSILSRTIATYIKAAHALVWGPKTWQHHYLRRLTALGTALSGLSLAKDIWTQQPANPVHAPSQNNKQQNGVPNQKQKNQEQQTPERKAYIDTLVQERDRRLVLRLKNIDESREELHRQLQALEQDPDGQENEKHEGEETTTMYNSTALADHFLRNIIAGQLQQAIEMLADEPQQFDPNDSEELKNDDANRIEIQKQTNTEYVWYLYNSLAQCEKSEEGPPPVYPHAHRQRCLLISLESAREYINNNRETIICDLLGMVNKKFDETYNSGYLIAKILIKLNDVAMMNTLLEIKKQEEAFPIPWVSMFKEETLLAHVLDHNHFSIMSLLMSQAKLFGKYFWKAAVQNNNQQLMKIILNHENFPYSPSSYSFGPILDYRSLNALNMLIRHVQKTDRDINKLLGKGSATVLDKLVYWGLDDITMLRFLIDNGAHCSSLLFYMENCNPKHHNYRSRQAIAAMLIAERDKVHISDYDAIVMALHYGLMDEAQNIIFDGLTRFPDEERRRIEDLYPAIWQKLLQAEADYPELHAAERAAQARQIEDGTSLPSVLIPIILDYAAWRGYTEPVEHDDQVAAAP